MIEARLLVEETDQEQEPQPDPSAARVDLLEQGKARANLIHQRIMSEGKGGRF